MMDFTYESAMDELSRPLVFGDEKQIRALRDLEKIFTCAERMLLCKKRHSFDECDECDGEGEHYCGCGDLHDCCRCNGSGYGSFSFDCECTDYLRSFAERVAVIKEALRFLNSRDGIPEEKKRTFLPLTLRPAPEAMGVGIATVKR